MAYKVNRISTFNFIAINGEPDESQASISIDSWPGVDGFEFTDEGNKANAFSLVTVTDCNDLLHADLVVRLYKELVAQGSVSIIKDGEALFDRFKVLSVTKLNRQAISTAVGNKQSAYAGALLECRWELIAVHI